MMKPTIRKWLRGLPASAGMLVLLMNSPVEAASTARASPAGQLPEAHLDGNYFTAAGHRFLALGAHWVPAKAGLQWPEQWDTQDITADFARMAAMGFNTVRLDLFWAWFEPRPGDYNPAAFAQLDFLIGLAHRYHIYLHPTLFVGGEVGEAYWDVPWRHGANPQSDPEMLRLETNLAREFGRRYAHETAILAWDLTDEPPFWIATGTTDAMASNWTRLIAGGIRRYDQLHPIVVGVSTQDLEHGPFRPDVIAGDVDFLSVHPYTIYTPELFPDPMVSERGTYGAAFEATLSRGAGKPVMVQEMGASSAQYSPEKVAQFDRVSLYSALGAGANGFLLWCYTDAAPEQYARVPYLRSPHETQFGLTTWDRKLRPQGQSFVDFIRLVSRVRLEELSVAGADAGIIIPEEWARTGNDFSRFGLTGPSQIPYVSVADGGAVNGQPPAAHEGNQAVLSSVLAAYIVTRRAGLRSALPREAGDWQQLPMVLVPAPVTATDPVFVHVHTDFWTKARQYVANGGALYASLSAASAVPDMETLFGARMTDTVPVTELTLKITKAFGELQPGETLRFSVPGSGARYWGTGLDVSNGEVIGVDQQGRPALVTHTVGKGRTLLSAYPLESWLGNQPQAFEEPAAGSEESAEKVHRLIRSFRDWSGVHPQVATDDSSVEASLLTGNRRGYVVLANHSSTQKEVHLIGSSAFRSLSLLSTGSPGTPVPQQSAGWPVTVPAYSGAILEYRQ